MISGMSMKGVAAALGKHRVLRLAILSYTAFVLLVCVTPTTSDPQESSDGPASSPSTVHQWPMFRHDLNHTGRSPYDTSSNTGALKWVFNTSGPIVSSPAIAYDGTIYVASDDAFFYAIWPNGTEKWRIPIANLTHSSPSIAPDGRIYLSTGDELFAISPSGTVDWKHLFGGDMAIYSSPTVGRDGTIYVGYQDHKIYAVNPNGTEKWNYTTDNYVLCTAAVAMDGTIHIGSYDHYLYSLNPNGSLKWKYKTWGYVLSSPSIGSDGTIYVGSGYRNGFYAFYPNGTLKWELHIFTDRDFVGSSPAIGADGTLYVGARDRHLYAIHPNGTVKWRFETGGWAESPAIGSDGTIYFGSRDNSLYAVYPNGSLKWEFETMGWVVSSPAIASDGTIYVGSGDGNLYAFGQEREGPVADAGPDQTVYEGDVVQFDGTGSYGGGEFSFDLTEPFRINNVTTGDQEAMSIAVDSKGRILIAWRDGREPGRGDIYFTKSTDGGETFDENKIVAEIDRVLYFPSEPRMVVDLEDNIYLVWRSWGGPGHNTTIMLAKSLDGGQTFTEPRQVNEPYWAARSIPSIAIGKNDTVYVAWHEKSAYASGSHVCVAKSEDKGETFGPCVLANTPTNHASGGSHHMTALATDLYGNVYVSWYAPWLTPGDDNIYVSRSIDGGESFETEIRVNDGTAGDEFWPSIETGPEGNVYVVWLDSRYPSPDCMMFCDVFLSRSTDQGVTFEPNVRVTDTSENSLGQAYVALDPLGTPYVGWTIWIESGVFIDRSTDRGESFGKDLDLLMNWSEEHDFLGSMAFSADGILHIVWNNEDDEPYEHDVYYSHSLTSLTAGNLTYEWDFDAAIDSDGNGNSTDDADAVGPTPTWIYGDNGNFTVTLRVMDELGNWDTDTMNVTVLNVLPGVEANHSCTGSGSADILLRIAGEKWHDVSFTIHEDGNVIFNETVMRVPGNPNEQMIGLHDFELNASRSYSAVARYTPEDDRVNGQPNGATPAWILLKSGGKEVARLHHTFNVKHPNTWIWRVDDLSSYFPERECTFTAYISDPGSDDLNITWDWGDGTMTEHGYYNDGVGPDPYPSPDVNPIAVTDISTHSYASAGTYTITLTVRDDDGGVVTQTLLLDLS